MVEQFSNTQPIYLQLVQRICRQIVRREVQPGEKLPSVRDLAVIYGVNPNTVQRVNMELERMKIVESRRGQGIYVTEDSSRLALMREQLKEEQITRFADEMRELGYSEEEIIAGVKAFLESKSKQTD
ncbi:GntR family transcriptional regulator [Paenibacillus radicis (ex Xue et al. 2023)]|uniref:GntR family transcriptional regulator n=2 Tax=Paenibacillus TaxID=44249 RepID=A0ABT1YAF6_9BACL|nr:GntR family transcriptional regulator [Paenibacillus radicis (ex Xue et al. 2023)]MCR8629877.1 GntR family transcriptional regulator [Paenibacillus radicis (ex Xue et al. 2023)]